MLKVKTKITSEKKMVLKEGVLANNDILNFQEFHDFIKPKIDEQFLEGFKACLNEIEKYIKAQQLRNAYIAWEALQADFLFNTGYGVSLLFIENINSPEGQYSFQYNTREYNILNESGNLAMLGKLIKSASQLKVEEQISEHLYDFFGDISTKTVRWKFIQMVFNLDDSDLKKNTSDARWRTNNWTYKNILYGDNPVWEGNAADAFMNHMAHLHVQVLAKEVVEGDKNLFANSVFNEEKDNIWNLLLASRNATPWFTGGDIVIKYGGQLYNIQLKTGKMLKGEGAKRSRIGGKLSTKKLLDLVNQLKADNDIEYLIQILYNELKTSGWVEKTNDVILKTAENFVDKSLTL